MMAQLGFRTMDEMVGRTDVLRVSERAKAIGKRGQLIYQALLYQPEGIVHSVRRKTIKSKNRSIFREILPAVQSAVEDGRL